MRRALAIFAAGLAGLAESGAVTPIADRAHGALSARLRGGNIQAEAKVGRTTATQAGGRKAAFKIAVRIPVVTDPYFLPLTFISHSFGQ